MLFPWSQAGLRAADIPPDVVLRRELQAIRPLPGARATTLADALAEPVTRPEFADLIERARRPAGQLLTLCAAGVLFDEEIALHRLGVAAYLLLDDTTLALAAVWSEQLALLATAQTGRR